MRYLLAFVAFGVAFIVFTVAGGWILGLLLGLTVADWASDS
jgi:hypothetical protein